ncbi:hypothetical protein T05_15664 [Trichinella murrelli]|uniref:Uncharacterized protein n=1 Tax=Trichinella murrelli TaxID=144512 RepID=A0A0V0SR68_9BILA|nr:hypothetical protein T05_15664 [Trichinella murrelli]
MKEFLKFVGIPASSVQLFSPDLSLLLHCMELLIC